MGRRSVRYAETTSTKVIPKRLPASKLILVSISQVRRYKLSARQESMALVAAQSAKTATLVSSKIYQGTPPVETARADGGTRTTARPAATLSPLDFTRRKGSSPSASVVSRAKVQTKLQSHVKQERTPTALDPCHAFHARQEHLQVHQEV